MSLLEPPDTHHLLAAAGWLELGNAAEALAELDRIAPACRTLPEVLEVRWSAHAHAKAWDVCLNVASSLIERAPERPAGWIDRSFALHEMKRTQEAWDGLLPAATRFPKHPIIAYNLACYACQSGRLDEARDWLKKAIRLGGDSDIRKMAQEDPDLAPLHPEIARR